MPLIQLDNRALSPSEPMVRILDILDRHPSGDILALRIGDPIL